MVQSKNIKVALARVWYFAVGNYKRNPR